VLDLGTFVALTKISPVVRTLHPFKEPLCAVQCAKTW